MSSRFVRFGEFEVDLHAWVLCRNGSRVALQRKPFQILRMLIARSGQLTTRSELSAELWPGLHVSYDRCLNTAVNALRRALNDLNRTSRFIETCPGLGYRFIGTLNFASQHEQDPVHNAMEADLAIGRYFLHRCSADGLARAQACFNALLQVDDKQQPAHCGLAEVEMTRAALGYAPPAQASERAAASFRNALTHDHEDLYAQAGLAVASAMTANVHELARTRCEDLLRSPKSSAQTASVRGWYAGLLAAQDRLREACAQWEGAKQADPLSLLVRVRYSLALYAAGNFERAAEQAWAALAIEPACSAAQHALALAYQQLEYHEDAITEFQNAACCQASSAAPLAGLFAALHENGRLQEAAAARKQFDNLAATGYVSPCWRALVHAAQGDITAAQASWDQAQDTHDPLLVFTRNDPRFASIRNAAALAHTTAI